jgi:hypothetical protein
MTGSASIGTVLAFLAFALFPGGTAWAGDNFHSCADASGDLIITDGVLRQPRPGTEPAQRPEIKFNETRRISIHRKEAQCVSNSCRRSFDYELESYLLFADFEYDGIFYQATFVCERVVNAPPAACDCDDESIAYQRDLKPEFTEKGKARKAR